MMHEVDYSSDTDSSESSLGHEVQGRELMMALRPHVINVGRRLAIPKRTKKPIYKSPGADGKYDREMRRKLNKLMTAQCQFCEKVLEKKSAACSHLIEDCKSIGLPDVLDEVAQNMRSSKMKGKDFVQYKVYNWEACPQDGFCAMTSAEYPPGVYCAPANWLHISMDFNRRKGQSAVRGTMKAHFYKHKKTGEVRRRFFTDKKVHMKWEELIRTKISKNEVKELLIPAHFWYWNAKNLKNLKGKNHAALIVLKFSDGVFQSGVMLDSVPYKRYYQRASSEVVRLFIKKRLFPTYLKDPARRKEKWLTLADPYLSVASQGCEAVVVFWLLMRYKGRGFENPNNSGTINFIKALLHNFRNQHPLMRGDDFDDEWCLHSKLNATTAGKDPEMENHSKEFSVAVRRMYLK